MELTDEICYRALASHDSRFDGLFYVGVTSTGIYCRPICTAKTPARVRCRFFPTAALAERKGFRPCLRCRPELAPGAAPVDSAQRIARRAAELIESGEMNKDQGVDQVAARLGVTSRQLRRVVRQEFGVSPVEMAQTQRLLIAKQLLTDSNLSIIGVAEASGFASVRRFNFLFRERYGRTPSEWRRPNRQATFHDSLQTTLAFRPPLPWQELLGYLARRAIPGVEIVEEDTYARTAQIGDCRGWLRIITVPGKNALVADLSMSLASVLPVVLARLRRMFDLRARPDVIDRELAQDSLLKRDVVQTPGIRVPGAFCSFEIAVRAILGQQISVNSATTLSGRWGAKFGEQVETPIPGLNRLSPTIEAMAKARIQDLTSIGIIKPRARAICEMARAVDSGTLALEAGAEPEQQLEELQEIPGIGPWTAQYIALRGLHWPDAFPAGDLGLLRAAGLKKAFELEGRAERWRPWRAYAAMRLWRIAAAQQPFRKQQKDHS